MGNSSPGVENNIKPSKRDMTGVKYLLEVNDQGRVFDQFPIDVLSASAEELAAAISSEKFVVEDGYNVTRHVLVLRNVFTQEECEAIIRASEIYGYESLEHLYPESYRNNSRVMIQDKPFVETWFNRMEPYILPYLAVQAEEYRRRGGRAAEGSFVELNARMRLCRYPKGGIFGRHLDGSVEYSNLYSKFTVMAYLHDIPAEQGGATRFFHGDKLVRVVQPEAGLVVIFPHSTMHDGQLCTADSKYIMRSDLMFV